jgi:deoxyribonuclease V
MHFQRLHQWDVTPRQAAQLQRELAALVIHDTPLDLARVRHVAGVDVSVKNNVSQAAVVVLTFPALEVVETRLAHRPTPFPYIAGLLSFREGPVLEDAFAQVETTPDALIFDGMGRAHPRRIGIASHMGLWLDRPTIGCGKSLLTGRYVEPPPERGSFAPLLDREEVIGAILRTREGTKPVFISVGHRADLPSAVELVMHCTGRYRLPEPIRAAHKAAGVF